MTSVLVLTGNTPFRGLERRIEELASEMTSVSFMLQTRAPHISQRNNIKIINFLDMADFALYDFIICHAGAGTVFHLLKEKLQFVCVPNLERREPHQLELFDWVKSINSSLACELEYLDCEALKKLLDNSRLNVKYKLASFNVNALIHEIFDI